ncbi:ATP-binding protein [Streptomyces subrutilus]|uniref:ATP-binding protein n=1 Tax=Streptomyces subrutilus TaxID=36818 RepID=UPI003444D79E
MDRTHKQAAVPGDPGDPAAQGGPAPAAAAPGAGPAAGAPAGGPAGTTGRQPAAGTPAEALRVVTLTAGDFSLTVNPVDGSEIEPHRPGTATRRPAKRESAARRAREAGARPPQAPGAPAPARLLPSRREECERLVRLLGRGRSVRLTGPAGSGRTTLLDAVAAECANLAPDGVVRLSGHGHQQPGELLHALYAAVYEAPEERPDRIELLSRVRDIGAVVLVDDLELGGPALDELLRATPECAYLLAATPDTRAPSDDAHLEEVLLSGLGRDECRDLLEAGLRRAPTDQESAWAEDLRFASEGLPLRFVQAAALLRQRDELNRCDVDDDEEEPGVFEERPRDTVEVPLPTLAEGAAPAELLASRVSESARAALRIACALGGELPHHAHLPALVGDTHADLAVAELLGCGLLTPVGTRYRLAAGVARQLEDVGYGDSAAEEARTAARHYVWWTGHASLTPGRVAAEADAVLAALAGADVVAAVLLARTAAPAFAASLHWEAWERVLRSGAEAARKAGEVAEQAYFHHELGVLALCEGRLDRARAELETSIGLRGALADKRGTVAGRRALALVADRESVGAPPSPPLRLEAPAALPGTVAPGAAAAAASAAAAAGAGLPAAPEPLTVPLPATDRDDPARTTPFPVSGAADRTTPFGLAGLTTTAPLPDLPPAPVPGAGAPGLPGTSAASVGPGPLGGPGTPGSDAGPAASAPPVDAGAPERGAPSGLPGATATATGTSAPQGTPDPSGAPGASAPQSGRTAFPTVRATGVPGLSTAPGFPGPSAAPGFPGTAGLPGGSGAFPSAGAPGGTGAPGTAGAPGFGADGGPGAAFPGGPAGTGQGPGAPEPSEAVTRLTPVVPVTRRSEPSTQLAQVFEEAFPLTPKRPPAPVPAAPAPAPAAGRRRVVLLAGAGALAVVALGTVVALAMGSPDPEAPPIAPGATTPAAVVPSVAPGTSGNDPAPTPPADPAAPEPSTARTGSPTPTPGRSTSPTASKRPSSTPQKSTSPTPSSPPPSSQEPTPSPTPPESSPPTGTIPTAPATQTATAG